MQFSGEPFLRRCKLQVTNCVLVQMIVVQWKNEGSALRSKRAKLRNCELRNCELRNCELRNCGITEFVKCKNYLIKGTSFSVQTQRKKMAKWVSNGKMGIGILQILLKRVRFTKTAFKRLARCRQVTTYSMLMQLQHLPP
ncbi:hypothetical protein POVWA2_071780 [Plasmodium ovale wallikeri]|uniref:Uncharacterized protein n=1 Tax=Plasmodium ovale wallikeri TaxID=864142 RepID=A0A1A9AHT9_PLAOA|nr:hypothetical protein POVWA1_065860 [Plasmodium ovale wallikeri]SBT56157.1 hypothetical protein POVWA2_071780 [Plasmodium ovale wallikeri]